MNINDIDLMWAAIEDDDTDEVFHRLRVIADAYDEDEEDEFAALLRQCAELQKHPAKGYFKTELCYEWTAVDTGSFTFAKEKPSAQRRAAVRDELKIDLSKRWEEMSIAKEWVHGSPTKRRAYEFLFELTKKCKQSA